jgi:penicillin amidase
MKQLREIWKTTASGIATAFVTGCAVLAPLPEESSLDNRISTIPTAGVPVEGRVTIYWNDRQIPFIEAEHDRDAAFALGLVHAHLRLGQMELFRRVSQGRIAEMGGPLATDLDRGLRIVDFGRAVDEIESRLPPATRDWLESFVAGINFYLDNTANLPVEFAVLGLKRETWTVRDILTMARLAAADVTWLVWFNLLPMHERDDWPRMWARLVGNGSVPILETSAVGDDGAIADLLGSAARSGSNSVAVARSRTASGAAMLANDPHLGIFMPNVWLIAGLKSPSYHVVGLMGAGLPVFAIGRNPWIAWGGTNLRAASSDLVDISTLAKDQFWGREEEIDVRWWVDERVTVRETAWGPVISDAPQFADLNLPDLALKWVGHTSSDEITAFLKISQARDFGQFVTAFDTFAIPAENMLYADVDGHIGMVMAARLPRRGPEPPADLIVGTETNDKDWSAMIATVELPSSFDPAQGYLVSANNDPGPSPVPIGYFFSPDDRVDRMAEIIESSDKVDVDVLAGLQQDVYMASAVKLRDLIMAKIAETGADAQLTTDQREALALIASWDGYYREDSQGAVAFEAFRAAFLADFYEVILNGQDWAAYAGIDRTQKLTREDIDNGNAIRLRSALKAGLEAAGEAVASGDTWGDRHRLVIQHPLGNLPIVGGRYRFLDLPVGGSSETLMKTAHGPAGERHSVRYGSQARHISDLSDPDANYFVLLGGQDGWFNSSTFLDQVDLWRQGGYVQVPLSVGAVRDRSVHETVLSP